MDSAQRSTAADRALTAQGISSSGSGQTQAAESSTMRAAIISLGGELFTIDLKNVREVFVVESITPVPGIDRKSTRLNSSHIQKSRMPSSA